MPLDEVPSRTLLKTFMQTAGLQVFVNSGHN